MDATQSKAFFVLLGLVAAATGFRSADHVVDSNSRDAWEDAGDVLEKAIKLAKEAVKDAVEDAKDVVSELAKTARDKAEDLADTLEELIRLSDERATEFAELFLEELKELQDDTDAQATEEAKAILRDLADRVEDLIEREEDLTVSSVVRVVLDVFLDLDKLSALGDDYVLLTVINAISAAEAAVEEQAAE